MYCDFIWILRKDAAYGWRWNLATASLRHEIPDSFSKGDFRVLLYIVSLLPAMRNLPVKKSSNFGTFINTSSEQQLQI